MGKSKLQLPWIRKRRKTEPELPLKAPVHLGGYSNGEIFVPETQWSRKVERMILEKADEGARRHGIDRREFLASTMGMATTLSVLNFVNGCSSESIGNGPASGAGPGGPGGMGGPGGAGGQGGFGGTGGRAGNGGGPDAGFQVPEDPSDPEQTCETMLDPSREFIFDIQSHHVNRSNSTYDFAFFPFLPHYSGYCGPNGISGVNCFSLQEYLRLMFLESDTTVAVLSGLPAASDPVNPLTNDEIAESRDIINMLAENSQRLITHHMVLPNQGGISPAAVGVQLDAMEAARAQHANTIGAWKCYPAWSPNNSTWAASDGYLLDAPETGLPFIEKGLELGIGTFCIHKGLPIPGFSTTHNDPADVGRVAQRFPEANFIVYHSGYRNNNNSPTEGPYTMGSINGINSLITAMITNEIAPNSNVYGELGTTWQTLAFGGSSESTAHAIGKLLRYVGEDNVVWGTDSVWYGSPQAQIESFLQFSYSAEFAQQHGYPELTMERKRKILGLNAARVYGIDPQQKRCAIPDGAMAKAKRALDADLGGRRWAFHTPAIRTRREFITSLRAKNLRPG